MDLGVSGSATQKRSSCKITFECNESVGTSSKANPLLKLLGGLGSCFLPLTASHTELVVPQMLCECL